MAERELVDLLVGFAEFLGYHDGDLTAAARTFLERHIVVETHVIELRGGGWAIEHPRSCREDGKSLLDCPVTHAAQLSVIKSNTTGRFYVEVQPDDPSKLKFLGEVTSA